MYIIVNTLSSVHHRIASAFGYAFDALSSRVALHITVEDLAETAKTSHRFVRSIEQGRATAAIQKLFDMMTELGVEVHLRLPPEIPEANVDAAPPLRRRRARP